MTTYEEAFEQGRKAVGHSNECPYEYESENEQLYNAWWSGFDERCEELQYADVKPHNYVNTEAHLHYYETRDY